MHLYPTKNIIQITSLAIVALLGTQCSNKTNEDVVNAVPKDGSIETLVSTIHATDSTDILITKHIVYKNAATSKVIETRDTIPALGTDIVPDDKEVPQKVKKEYNIYITVK